MSFDVNADIRQAQEDAKRLKSKAHKKGRHKLLIMDNDLISRKALLKAYDKAHKGPPGGARKLIEEAPSVSVQFNWPSQQAQVIV